MIEMTNTVPGEVAAAANTNIALSYKYHGTP